MRMNRSYLLLLLILIPSFIVAQDVQLKRERTFTGDGLYGYMDGGADQYLEYGVSKLVSRDVVFKGEEYTIDVYDFPSPEDAFGIYSLHIFKCISADSDNCIDCLSAYQFQTVAGNNYVSVVFPSGSNSARINAKELANHFISLDSCRQMSIPKLLNVSSPSTAKLKYLRGPIGLSGTNLSLSKLLSDTHYSAIWLLPSEEGTSYKALIIAATKDDMQKIKSVISADDIISSGEDFLFMQGKVSDTDSDEDYHEGFGF